jgi:hypothetical protein
MQSTDSDGRLADNIIFFARALRKAGMQVGPASVNDAIEAVLASGIGSREDFYWTLHANLVKRHEDSAVFEEAFRLYWRSRELIEKLLAMFSPQAPANSRREKQRIGETRVSDALFEGHRKNKPEDDTPEIEVDARMSASGKEILRQKDFAQMSAQELRAAKRAIAEMKMPDDLVKTRRYRPASNGQQYDPRATMRKSVRGGADLILPQFRTRRTVKPPIVVLADISGSMSQYSRVFLHFVHALSEQRGNVHSFLFGTRLTNITRQIRHRDIDHAISQCVLAVDDWSGGTRIGEALHEFNRHWSRRVLGQGVTLIIITDGLERDDVSVLDVEMQRLQKTARRVIWLNPLLRFDGFEPRARGVKTMLDHVDEFRPVHNIDSLQGLCEALSSAKVPTAPKKRHKQSPVVPYDGANLQPVSGVS